jgi:hypothetical protein
MFIYVFLELCQFPSRLTIYLSKEDTELIKGRYLKTISYATCTVECQRVGHIEPDTKQGMIILLYTVLLVMRYSLYKCFIC